MPSSRASRAASARSTARAGWACSAGSSRCWPLALGRGRSALKFVPELLPQMDAEVAALGRSVGARTKAAGEAVIRRIARRRDRGRCCWLACGAKEGEGRREPSRHHRLRPPSRPEQARAIAKEAYIYGFPMVDNYRVQYAYFVDKQDPEYKGGWNEIHNTARVFTPEDNAIQTPNSDTPYSAVGADLRAEPLVLTVPPIEQDRYYSLQFVDGYTYNFALRRQPHHRQRRRQVPAGRAGVEGRQTRRHRRGDPVGHRAGPRAVPHPTVRAVRHRQTSRRSRPDTRSRRCRCSCNQPPPPPAPAIDFVPPLTPDQQKTSPQFFEILSFVMRFAPTLPDEQDLRARFATIGIGARRRLRRRRAEPRRCAPRSRAGWPTRGPNWTPSRRTRSTPVR